MSPVVLLGEARQEGGGRDGAGRTAPYVGHVGKRALQLFLILVEQRQAPGAIAGLLGGVEQLVGQGVVVRQQTRGVVTQGDDAGAGQGRHVDHGFGIVAIHIGEGIAQHQATLGVGVEHLDGLAGHGGEDVTRAIGVAARHVLAARQHADDVDGQLQLGQGVHGAEHGGGAAHVVLHLVHAVRRLDGDAARIEGQSLAHQYDGLGVGVALVFDDGHHGFVLGAAGHRQVGVHAEFGHLLLAYHLGGDVVIGIRQTAGLGGEVGRIADVGRHVRHVAADAHPFGHGQAVGDGALAYGQFPTRRHVEDQLAQRAARLGLVGLELIEAVEARLGGFHRLTHLPVGIPALDVQLGQEADGFHGPGLVQGGDGLVDDLLVLAFVEFPLLAATDQQYALAEHARYLMQQQHLAWFAFQIAAAQQRAEVAVADLVQLFGNRREAARLKNADHDAGAALLLRTATLYTELHGISYILKTKGTIY